MAAGASGTIHDVNGQGVGGAFVMLFDNSANAVGYAITALDGSFTFLNPLDNTPISDATVDGTDGFVVEQQSNPPQVGSDNLGIYQYQPRAYLKPVNTPVAIVLPLVSSFVLEGYLQDGTMMRWGDFVSSGPGQEGAAFAYMTNLDEEEQPAVVWPTYDDWAREPPRNADRQYGLPSLVVDSRNTGPYCISVMFWNVKNYGKLCLKADNGGAGFQLPAQGGSLVINVNLELARTAINDLSRRQTFYQTYITDEDIPGEIATAAATPNVDDRLSNALQLRDHLELKAARNSINAVRKGTLKVTARDVDGNPVKDCAVTINQTAHDFLFGANGGAPFTQQQPVWQRIKDMGCELAPVLPAWGFTENPNSPYQYMGKTYVESEFGISQLKDMGFKVKMTGSVWMQGAMGILPPRTAGMTWQEIRTANLANQDLLLNDFKDDGVIWEAMNEPATTNTVGMPRPDMAQMLNTSALNIKAANSNLNTLVNSPPEFDFGYSYQSYNLDDNLAVNDYSTTYSDFLKQARTTLGNLDSIDTIGIQFYPGAHVSPQYGAGEAPAFTPSWLVDTANRYNTLFGKPVHITELSFPSSYDTGTWHSGYWKQPWDEATQADYAESVYTMMFADPNVHSVLYWDMSDDGSFVTDGGLIRADLSAKPSFTRIQGLIDSWTTHDEEQLTDTGGQTTLGGFGGDYDVTVVAPDGKTVNTTAHIDERQENDLTVGGFNPVPTTTSIVPDHKTAGDPGFTLAVNGTNFVAGSKVHWNGAERTTTYVSDTQITAAIPAGDITTDGTASVTVMNPGNLESNEQTFTIGTVPVPTTTSLSPDHKTAGDAQFTLTVNGTNFVAGSRVRWNGVDRTTSYVSDAQLTATITSGDIATAGTASVTVFNPTPGGGISNAQTFTINNPSPVTTGLSPDHKTAGNPGFTLTVSGTGFVAGSQVRWNGSARVTTYVSDTEVTATIPQSDLSPAGQAQVTVFNPGPGGGASNPQAFTIDESPAPAPTLSMITPVTASNGGSVTVALTGDNFVNGAAVALSRSGAATVHATNVHVTSAQEITCTLGLKGAKAGSYTVSVTNPDGKSADREDSFTVTEAPAPQKPEPPAPVVATTPTWYLAEGTSDYGFTTYVTIENPNTVAVTASVIYMTKAGPKTRPDLKLPAMSQTVINPANDIGATDFSTKVTCKEGKTICVDRRMTWTGPGAPSPEGHSSVGVTAPARTWYLAEGSSKWGFECWLLIQNPGTTTAHCAVTYMIEGSGPQVFHHDVPAGSRASFNMADDIGPADASIKVTSDIPVIPERAMYRNNRREGHDSIGTTTSAKDYYLAEGTTDWGFTTYVLVQNPNASANTVNITYMTPKGPVAQAPFTMEANSRKTINVNNLPGMSRTDCSIHVQGSLPIIAERAMYWGAGTPLGEACHDSIGMDSPHTTFYLPDGETYNGMETWTLVQNPNKINVTVEISYLTPDGKGIVTFNDIVPANSRKTYNMTDKIGAGRAAIMVTSRTTNGKIMVERSMYWNNRGAGTDTIGGFADQ